MLNLPRFLHRLCEGDDVAHEDSDGGNTLTLSSRINS